MTLLLALASTPVVDVTTILNGWQALVAITLIICVVALPSILTYLGNKRVKTIENTLTTNNGGSHIKDALDRIELRQVTAEQRLDTLEASQSALQKKRASRAQSKKTAA